MSSIKNETANQMGGKMSTKENNTQVKVEKAQVMPLTMTFAYLEISILLSNIQENFDITPKANCKIKSLQQFADTKLLQNRKSATELFAS